MLSNKAEDAPITDEHMLFILTWSMPGSAFFIFAIS